MHKSAIQAFPKISIISFTLAALVFLSSCTSPSIHFHNKATANQLTTSYLSTPSFQHVIYKNNASLDSLEKTLHIYLDGDGSPWLQNRWIAKDPTARSPMILELIDLDKQPSILLGRPCYYGLHATQGCHYRFWTSHRYGEKVIKSMADALSLWLVQHPHYEKLTFVGYSGGGTLAVLLAPYFTQTHQIITIAANLDIDAWTTIHGYSPLLGSLNPIKQTKLLPTIKQLHLSGDKDTNVPSAITKSYVERQESAKFLIIKNQSHCCWQMQWLSILAIIE